MPALGTFLLLTCFVVAAYAATSSIAGARRQSTRLTESGIGAFYLVTALMAVASAVIMYAFVTDTYSIKYVDRYSDAAQPLLFKITAYWGGLDGSIMFWVLLLSVFGAIAVRNSRESHRELIPYVVAVIAIVEMFFLFLMVVHNNPFETYLADIPPDGQGLNPLLQNVYMVIHPPSLYIGFVGMTIPFAFGMAALATGHLDDSWLRAVRRWTMVSWLFLSLGLTLGMIWAYEELGWGGYWGWDPVENAGLLPWFTATAFLHSVMVQERRGMLRVWNMTLVIVTFFLTIFGTFMTRSGVVQSVHAFGEDKELAWMFTVFMTLLLVTSFGLLIYRLPLLRARHELDSWVSREAAFLVNNWILLFSAMFVLFATMFPTLSEAVAGRATHRGPAVLQQVDAADRPDAAAPDRHRAAARVAQVDRRQSPPPVPVADASRRSSPAPALAALGVRVWSSGTCFALSAFVVTTLVQEFVRGARVRQQYSGSDLATSAIGLVARNQRRYGGYIVHLGIVLMAPGLCRRRLQAGRAVAAQAGPVGDGGRLHGAARRHRDHAGRPEADGHGEDDRVPGRQGTRHDRAGQVVLQQAGRGADHRSRHPPVVRLRPVRRAGRLRRRAAERHVPRGGQSARELDLGRVRAARDGHADRVAAGTGVGRGRREGAGRQPRPPAPRHRRRSCLLVMLVLPGLARAQDTGTIVKRSHLEREFENEILCTCGCRLPAGTCGMFNCPGKAKQLGRLKAVGRTRATTGK